MLRVVLLITSVPFILAGIVGIAFYVTAHTARMPAPAAPVAVGDTLDFISGGRAWTGTITRVALPWVLLDEHDGRPSWVNINNLSTFQVSRSDGLK